VEQQVVMLESGLGDAQARQLVTLAGQLRRLSGYDLDESVSTRCWCMPPS
jgi:nitric oxide reductase NorQ protein